jgi:hypothetical protein
LPHRGKRLLVIGVESTQDTRVMFKWLKSLRRRKTETVSVQSEADRDSGEEEYESREEDAREIAPSRTTRAKTNNI